VGTPYDRSGWDVLFQRCAEITQSDAGQQLMNILRQFWGGRLWSLIRKEVAQILRNKQLLTLLIIPPTLQLLIYGFALNPDVHNLKLGIVDYAQTADSRGLVSAFTNNQIFTPEQFLFSEKELATQVETGALTAGVVIPPKFSRRLANQENAEIQILVDGVDANTAGIASGYLAQMVQQFSFNRLDNPQPLPITTEVTFLYNPGLNSSWFFVPGVMGLVLTLIGTIVSSITVVREKDTGTLEQLLMTPAAEWEILLSKIVPLFVLLMGDVMLALTLGRVIFNLPFRGSFPLFMGLSGLYVFVGISVGILLATLCQSQQQVVLTTFFINLPMVQLSGAIAPIETMPPFFQSLSWFNPLRHYIAIVRGILLKGVGIEALWQNMLMLVAFVVVLFAISTNRFRKQLS
jgi:ABC-2 type transport system permease protein